MITHVRSPICMLAQFSTERKVVGTQKNCLIETNIWSTFDYVIGIKKQEYHYEHLKCMFKLKANKIIKILLSIFIII